MAQRRQALLFGLAGLVALAPHIRSGEAKPDSAVLIEWLLQDGRDLKGIPFSEVPAATTGKNILPVKFQMLSGSSASLPCSTAPSPR